MRFHDLVKSKPKDPQLSTLTTEDRYNFLLKKELEKQTTVKEDNHAAK